MARKKKINTAETITDSIIQEPVQPATKSLINTMKSDPKLGEKIFSSVTALVFISLFVYFSFYIVPGCIFGYEGSTCIFQQSKTQESATKTPENATVSQEVLDKEAEGVSFTDRTAVLNTNFGELKIDLQDQAAPRLSENFIRLINRGYYNNLTFHRIVKQEGFAVIQGGDPQGNGTGGESAFGVDLADEIWEVAPEYDQQGGAQLLNEPKFKDASLYPNYNPQSGTVTYPKGWVIMANKGPNTNSSQFFITLTDTTLPAAYSVFGKVETDSFAALDKINAEVNPVSPQGEPAQTVSLTKR